MTDQIEDFIREIAAKNSIAVARDDPILVLQTINQRLLADSAKAQQAQLDTCRVNSCLFCIFRLTLAHIHR